MAQERLDKIIAAQGRLSRKEVKKLIQKKLVSVNHQTVTDPGFKLDPQIDPIEVQGTPLHYQAKLYIMLHKPAGIVSASRDHSAKTVLDLLPPDLRRKKLFPAGRLDKDTTGLMLITDDGDFAHNILSPRKHVTKTYEATLDQPLTDAIVEAFARGITLADGECCLPAQLYALDPDRPERVGVQIKEGKYHQIKRMFHVFHREVLTLKRVQIGNLALDPALREGECRMLAPEEVQRITAVSE